jgi:hypothetical protein
VHTQHQFPTPSIHKFYNVHEYLYKIPQCSTKLAFTHVIQFKSLLAMEQVGMTTSSIDNYKHQVSRGTYNPQGSNPRCFHFFQFIKEKTV